PLEQELQSVRGREHPRDPLRAAGARKESDLDLGQAEPRLRIVSRDAMMAGKRQLETPAHRRAIERANPRLSAVLDASIELRQLAAFLEQHARGGLFTLVLGHGREYFGKAIQHG